MQGKDINLLYREGIIGIHTENKMKMLIVSCFFEIRSFRYSLCKCQQQQH